MSRSSTDPACGTKFRPDALAAKHEAEELERNS